MSRMIPVKVEVILVYTDTLKISMSYIQCTLDPKKDGKVPFSLQHTPPITCIPGDLILIFYDIMEWK